MDKKKTPKTPSKKKPAETSKEKFARMTDSMDALSSDAKTSREEISRLTNSLDTLASEAEKSKEEISRLANSIDARASVAETSEEKFSSLTDSMDALSSELETIKLNIQKRKSENTTLKILFYTGLIALLLGFLYNNATLQRAQMDSMESSIHTLRTLMNNEMLSVEKNVYQKIDRLEKDAGEQSNVTLQERLDSMALALSRLDSDDEKTNELIQKVQKNSRELGKAVSEQEKPLGAMQVNPKK